MGSHRKWRAEAKKIRRKRIRQKLAQERDELLEKEHEEREKSPKYQAWVSEQRALELFAEEEEARLSAERHKAWLAEEVRAQKAWKERQERLALARAERAKQELRIKEEWEQEQQKLKAIKEEKERIAQEKQQKQEDLMRQIESFINKGCDMPPEVNVASVTNPDKSPCPFFTKTGACRFGDRCSRNHTRPAISRVLLVPNFYDHIGLRQMNPDELEAADDWLEYEDSETYQHFLVFYEDVLPEWESIGTISQFKVCCNFEPHLRGNVYIEYESAQHAVQAFKKFHGRFYGGKQINVEFVNIDSWKAAICGQFHKQSCPKGRACNFLHVFRNPGNAFHAADRDRQEWRLRLQRTQRVNPPSQHRGRDRSWSTSPENHSRRKDWRWSASPSPPPGTRSPASQQTYSERSHHGHRDNGRERRRSSRKRDSRDRSRRRSRSAHRSHSRKCCDSNSQHREHTLERNKTKNSREIDSSDKRRTKTKSVLQESRKLEKPSVKVPLGDREILNSVNGRSDQTLWDRDLNPTPEVNSGTTSPHVDITCSVLNVENVEGLLSVEKARAKDKKSKRKKSKKDSHRKEKRRKKVSQARTDFITSSETSSDSGK